ncbi:hypothetical protein Tco_0779279 [Tanacetum coccineum]
MVLPDNQVGSPNSMLDNEMFEISSNAFDLDVMDHPNDEEVNSDNVVILQYPNEEVITRIYNTGTAPLLIREVMIWDKIRNPLSLNHIEHGYSIYYENTINMINSIKDLSEENRNMFSFINEAIKLMLAMTTNMSRVIENIIEKQESKDNIKEYDTLKICDIGREKESKALMLNDQEKQAIKKVKSNRVHGINVIVESSTIPKLRNRRRSKQIVKPELRSIVETPVATMADTHTMSESLQAPTEGYEDAIVIAAILAKKIKLKVRLLQLVTSSQFHGFERDDPHAHIRWFNKITSMLKYKNVPYDAIKLMFFLFSLEGPPEFGLKKNPLVLSIHGKISEACDRFKDLFRKCPHHGFLELHQIDTFYSALTQFDQDSLNAAAGGNLLNRTPRDALTIIENKLKVRTSQNRPIVSKVSITTSSSSPSPDITALTNIIKELMLMNKDNQQAFVKTIEETCVTCGGPHPYYECLATDSNTFNVHGNLQSWRRQNFNQGNNNYQDPNYQAQVGPSNELTNYMKRNEATLRAMQTQMTNMKTELRNEFKSSLDTRTNKKENQNNQIMNMLTNLTMQKQNPSGSGSLPSNTVANPRGDVKAITTRSGVSYDGPTIPPTPSPLPKKVERETEATKDKVQTTNLGSTAHVQPPVVQVPIPEHEVALKPNPKPSIPYPSRLNVQKLREKANNQMLKFLQIFQRLHFDISFADALLHMPKFASTFKSLLSNKEK